MHTARSRNDLQACYQRMAVREALTGLCHDVLDLRSNLLELAGQHVESVMPGYTHAQPAQPITFGHYLLGVHDVLARDTQRLIAAWHRTNYSPLGAGALATTGFAIDRQRCAELLGFEGVVENSIDSVASRDYLMESLAACVGVASSISRASTDLITWSAWEYGFVEIADELASGSSIMPQKKNPLALEHTRAKLAHVLASYTSVVTLTKGLPFTHTRDTGSEAFHLAFDGLSETRLAARLFSAILGTLIVRTDRMAAASGSGFTTATELADTLVRRCGLPFRLAHDVVGTLVGEAVRNGARAAIWSLRDVRRASATHGADVTGLTESDVATALAPQDNVETRSVQGGPAPREVTRMLAARRTTFEEDRAALRRLVDAIEAAVLELADCRARYAISGGGT
jgi:argininosuccinate lyase